MINKIFIDFQKYLGVKDPISSLTTGTSFPNLIDEYSKIYINTNNLTEEEMLRNYIKGLELIKLDLMLFLDININEKALKDLRDIISSLNKMIETYEEKFEVISMTNADKTMKTKYRWALEDFPWERGY